MYNTGKLLKFSCIIDFEHGDTYSCAFSQIQTTFTSSCELENFFAGSLTQWLDAYYSSVGGQRGEVCVLCALHCRNL